MLIQKNVCLGILCVLAALPFFLPNSYGHGLGYEILPPVQLGDKMVALEVTSSQYEDPDNPDREIKFALFDTETGVTISETTYHIVAKKGGEFLFENTIATSDGILIMNFLHSDSDEIILTQENQASFFESLIGAKSDVIQVTGKTFNRGGLYTFKVLITTADSFSNVLENPIEFNVGLSVPQRDFYNVDDPNFGIQQLSVVTYYDEIENFQYDPASKSITFEMPFEWNEENINQTSVVHEELTLPKTFGELMVSDFTVKVNDYEVPNRVITIDGFSEVQRIIHIVLNQNDLLGLYKEQQSGINVMKFLLKPQSENLPLRTVTGNGQFRISLDWEPKDVRSGSKVTFFFDILDVFLKDRPVSVSYDLSVIHKGEVLFTQNGISTGTKGEHNVAEFFVPEDLKGVITIQFDNLDGNSLARVGLPVVVDRIELDSEIIIPNWVRNNAGWWSNEQISDNDFASGIEFMIKENIIKVPPTNSKTSANSIIPEWVKNNAGWWSERLISDKEFVNSLQYLIANGIISV